MVCVYAEDRPIFFWSYYVHNYFLSSYSFSIRLYASKRFVSDDLNKLYDISDLMSYCMTLICEDILFVTFKVVNVYVQELIKLM